MSDLGYTNARIRSWKSDLFSKEFFEKLMVAKDVDEVTGLLGKTEYQADIEKGVIKYPGVSGYDEGLRINLTKTLQKLIKIVKPDKKAERLIRLILSRWDIYNLKTLLRGYHSSAQEKEIFEHLIPVGTLDEVALRILVKQPGMKAAIDQLIVFSPQYARPLVLGFRKYKEDNNLANLELELDKFYFESALFQSNRRSKDAKIVNQVIRREIDFINVMTLFRLIREPLPDESKVEEHFLVGGMQLPVSKLIDLSQIKDVKETIEALSTTAYYKCLKKSLEKYLITGSLSNIERSLEDFNTRKIISLFKTDPLSIAMSMAYIWAKINEIINVRIILRGKEVEMPPNEIKGALVLV